MIWNCLGFGLTPCKVQNLTLTEQEYEGRPYKRPNTHLTLRWITRPVPERATLLLTDNCATPMAPTFDGCVPDPYMVWHAAWAEAEFMKIKLKTRKLKQALYLRKDGMFWVIMAAL